MHARGLPGAVEFLLTGQEDDDLFPPPALTPPAELFAKTREARAASGEKAKREMLQKVRREQGAQIRALRSWWLDRMRQSLHPLREKMTLFWHGHFATSFKKVEAAFMMWQQNETLRANALGSFGRLTREIARDPAMMRYLDVPRSGRNRPNENFARELMELFTLGEGTRYTESDVREAARAFTGCRIDPETMQFRFAPRQFDAGGKTFLGKTGNFNGDAIIEIILAQPECAEFIAARLWGFLAAQDPPARVVRAVAETLRTGKYEMRPTLREIFLSEEFYSPGVVRSQVKSPVQWLVQTARELEAPLPAPEVLEAACAQLGQVLFDPPNVKGWEGGIAWITSSSLFLRYNLAGYIVSGKAPALDGFRKASQPVSVPLERIAPPAVRSNHGALCDALSGRLLHTPPNPEARARFVAFLEQHGKPVTDATLRDFLHLLMSTPEFQLT